MDFQELLLKVAKILDDLSISYAVTGGYAVSMLGRIRSTLDIDVIIELPHSKISLLTEALKIISEMSYVDENMVVRAVERKDEFNFIHVESGIKVDFFVQGSDAYSKGKFQRRIAKKIGKQTIYLVSPEDLILSKLRWHKISESSRQLEDVESIIKIQRKLDWKYLSRWSKIHKTSGVLESLRKRVGRT